MYNVSLPLALLVSAIPIVAAIIIAKTSNGFRPVIIYFFIFWTFIQYFLSPDIAFLFGGWDSFLLVEESANYSIFVAIGFVASVTIGYSFANIIQGENKFIKKGVGSFKNYQVKLKSIVYLGLVSWLLLASSHMLSYGSLDNLFISNLARGAGQFRVKDLYDQLASIAKIASLGISGSASIMIGLWLSGRSRFGLSGHLIAIFLLALLSSPLTSDFSRASGFPMFIAAISTRMNNSGVNKNNAIVPILVALGLYICVIGITHRGMPQGIFSFWSCALSPHVDILIDFVMPDGDGDYSKVADVNFFDALAPLSAHIYFSDGSDRFILRSLVDIIFAAQPLPNAFFQHDVRFGASLAEAFGTTGSLGLTTPALGELYFLFGGFYLLLSFFYGFFLHRVDLGLYRDEGRAKFVVFALALAGIVVSGHSGLRAFFRPTTLSIVLMFLGTRTYKLGSFRVKI